MSHDYAKFKENPCVGTDASTPLQNLEKWTHFRPTFGLKHINLNT